VVNTAGAIVVAIGTGGCCAELIADCAGMGTDGFNADGRGAGDNIDKSEA
jgi:hypothetical protein